MSPIDDSLPEDDPVLRDALKRCSPATYYAACKFKKNGHAEDLRSVVCGIIERFVDRELRTSFHGATDALRLRDDLGLDSLTMMEIVMIAEEALRITVSNEELTALRTLGDVQDFIRAKTSSSSSASTDSSRRGDSVLRDSKVTGGDVRRIQTSAERPISPLLN